MMDAVGHVFTLVVDRNGIIVNTFMAIAPRAVCVHDVGLLFCCHLFKSWSLEDMEGRLVNEVILAEARSTQINIHYA